METTKCDGWGVKNCQNEPTLILISPGCPYCGGSDCGATADAELSCVICAEPFKKYARENTDIKFEIKDFNDQVIWDNRNLDNS